MNTKIIVVTHKKYDDIYHDSIYIPVEVGAINREKHYYENIDCTGDNISEKNYCYCELTGLYWAWKNLDYDILGLCHYRRYFSQSRFELNDKKHNILKQADIEKVLSQNDIILPKTTKLKESIYNHSIHY